MKKLDRYKSDDLGVFIDKDGDWCYCSDVEKLEEKVETMTNCLVEQSEIINDLVLFLAEIKNDDVSGCIAAEKVILSMLKVSKLTKRTLKEVE